MNKRLILAASLLLAPLAACAAPTPSVLPPCGATVTTVAEGATYPCRPIPPQRMDVLMNGTDEAAVIRCGLLGGAPTNDPLALAAGRLRCRTVAV
jgi:hypothetical protein